MIENRINRIVLLSCLLLGVVKAFGQAAIPPGTWRLHLSYRDIRLIEHSPENVFAAGTSGIVVYNIKDRSLKTYNKLNALSGTGITALGYDTPRRQLLVGYANGVLDIIGDKESKSFTRLRDADVTASKKINAIVVHDDLAYLSTAYGVVIFDLQQLEIKETWRDLSVSGEQLAVREVTFLNDSIFIASADGVLAGNRHDNLLDFNNWTRFPETGPVHTITSFNNKVYAAGNAGLYRFTGNGFVQATQLQNAHIASLSASESHLLAVADSTVWIVDAAGNATQVSDPTIVAPERVRQTGEGVFWIADRASGLVSNASGTFSAYLPDGPSQNDVFRMVQHQGRIVTLSGGFTTTGQPLHQPGKLNTFENGRWETTALSVTDLTDVVFLDNKMYTATFGDGIIVTDADGNVSYLDETNSPLRSTSDDARITALARSASGLWVANYGGDQSLHLLRNDDTWQSFAFPYVNANRPIRIAVDGRGNVWMTLNPELGGGLIALDPATGATYEKTTAAGAGNLPHDHVGCMATDRDGAVWVGTNSGAAYFLSVDGDAVKPIYESRFLLRNERITALAVDGGNRKWIGTESGAWLFSPTGEVLIHHFTADNSPLLSDSIGDIAIHPTTGEVFFATDRGIASYRSDATEAGPRFSNVRVFPNPVHPNFTGTVAIDGLASDALVRITDISGKLVWRTQAHGGTATWNVRDHHDHRVSTGVYLVFAVTEDGTESEVAKIAVISY